MYTPVVEDYLKAIWSLQQIEAPVSTSRIAERLGLTAAAVTAMVKRLAEQRLLRHEPYHGVRLTPAGELAALRIIRRHRVLELFLTEILGYEWDRVHEEAERLEHHVSTEFETRMDELLGHPKFDPHGDPIPSRLGDVPPTQWVWLSELPEGSRAVLRRVSDRNSQQLRFLSEIGLVPGVVMEISQSATQGEGDSRTVLIAGQHHAISSELAASMQVEVVV